MSTVGIQAWGGRLHSLTWFGAPEEAALAAVAELFRRGAGYVTVEHASGFYAFWHRDVVGSEAP